MPVYKDTLAPERAMKGLTGHAARRVQLEHEALAHVFDDWTERTADAVDLCWAGSLRRKSKLYLGNDGKTTKPGPSASQYERGRAVAGAHLLFNAFWLISSFCICQMYMRDSLHQVDHGVIIHILRGILRLFFGELVVICINLK
jgi:hypothetical protein